MTKFYRPVGDKACVFPVGSVIFTDNTTNPTKWYGGTWTRLSGGYIYAVANGYQISSYTGTGTQSKAAFTSGSTVLGIDHIPSHQHMVYDGSYGASRQVEISGFNDTNGGMIPSIRQISGAGSNSGRLYAGPVGGGAGHTHSIPAHSHNISYIGLICWRRTA